MAVTGEEILLVERNLEHHYAILTINREERGNALSVELMARLVEAWKQFKNDDEIWSIILTAKGNKHFSAGADLHERNEMDLAYEGKNGFLGYVEEKTGGARTFEFTPQASELWKPVIGAINGTAVAGGFLLSQWCDVRIAAENAEFGVPETRWNLPAPFMPEAQRLVSPAWAMEATFWGKRRYSAQRMYELGFVNKVVPGTDLLSEAKSWAEELCEHGPVSVWNHKELMYKYLYPDSRAWWTLALGFFGKQDSMEDSLEGPRAFAEKRMPNWKLR